MSFIDQSIIQNNHLGDIAKTVGLFEAKQNLWELVERASEGEQIGITRRGKLAARLAPERAPHSLKKLLRVSNEFACAPNPYRRG